MNWIEAAERLKAGEVGIIPTDTIYGIVASAWSTHAVERIYELKKRDSSKPGTILSTVDSLSEFNLAQSQLARAMTYWPGPVSVVMDVDDHEHLHRGMASLAIRVPRHDDLQALLRQVGPLVSSSANHSGETPATNITLAESYFADQVDFYVDGGDLVGKPSTIVSVLGEVDDVLRG